MPQGPLEWRDVHETNSSRLVDAETGQTVAGITCYGGFYHGGLEDVRFGVSSTDLMTTDMACAKAKILRMLEQGMRDEVRRLRRGIAFVQLLGARKR